MFGQTVLYVQSITSGQDRTRHVRSYAPYRWHLSAFEGATRGDLPGTLDAWSAAVVQQGRRPSETIEVGIVVPAPEVARQLGGPHNTISITRAMVRGLAVGHSAHASAPGYIPCVRSAARRPAQSPWTSSGWTPLSSPGWMN